MKRLPIGQSTLRKIIDSNCCYVDKTPFVKQLLDDNNGYWFLSRPRRFGKTLFLDTLRAAFAGEKELFKGLYLEKNWDWDKKYPIISISFGAGTVYSRSELLVKQEELLSENAEKYNIKLKNKSISGKFRELIIKLNKKFKLGVVVLIDEYDKPLLDNITKTTADEMRDGLASFYSVLKDSDVYLKFVFLTGVSKFSKTSIFSKLNNLTDISLSEKYADICGYTQNEFEGVFSEYLKGEDLEKIQEWYDGYNFLGSNVYNPFDILLYLSERKFKCYWFETGTPTFLLNLFREQKYFLPQLDDISLQQTQMGEFDINHMEIESLLYQTGYLTIKKEFIVGDLINYQLKMPNKEVQIGFYSYMLKMFYAPGEQLVKQSFLSNAIYFALNKLNPEKLEHEFKSFFASVPHDWYRKNEISEYEGYYCSTFYAYFKALGLNVIPEDVTNTGNIDFSVIMNKAIFIFEVKLKRNPKNALEQIKDKKYSDKYLSSGKEIFLIGIEFDENEKNISSFECERLTMN